MRKSPPTRCARFPLPWASQRTRRSPVRTPRGLMPAAVWTAVRWMTALLRRKGCSVRQELRRSRAMLRRSTVSAACITGAPGLSRTTLRLLPGTGNQRIREILTRSTALAACTITAPVFSRITPRPSAGTGRPQFRRSARAVLSWHYVRLRAGSPAGLLRGSLLDQEIR